MKQAFLSLLCAGILLITTGTAEARKPNLSQHPDEIAKTDAAKEKPASTAPKDQSYRIRAGDLLRVTVWKEDGLDRDVLVMPDGMIDFPLIGSFKAADRTTSDLQRRIKSKLAPFIHEASVAVVVKETRGNAVSIIGQVARPGEVVMNRSLTVMQALSQVGGLTAYADEDDIKILRTVDGEQTSINFDYSEIADGDDLASNITLMPGDVIVVPTAGLF